LLANDLIRIKDLEVRTDVPLAPLTTFRIGGVAGIFLLPATVCALEKVMEFLEERGVNFRILGRGSNLLIDDRGFEVVLSLSRLDFIEDNIMTYDEDGSKRITCYAGCSLKRMMSWAARHGLGGMETLSGIPGSLGGAVFMNAGAGKNDIGDLVDAVLLTGRGGSEWIRKEALNFSYRSINLPSGKVISAASLCLMPKPRNEILGLIQETIRSRASSQPIGKRSAGCVFKNPGSAFAGRLIESCGLKGFRVGDAQVSEMHANFIINLGKAVFSHVLDLMEIIREKVRIETGFMLEPEITIWRGQ
jgi:UDP-N-acetylmuramate dehydrogenase